MNGTEAKEYDRILVIGSCQEKAKFVWKEIRHKYPIHRLGGVSFASRRGMYDGYNPFLRKILIVLVDGYETNPTFKTKAIQFLMNNGAEVVIEDNKV